MGGYFLTGFLLAIVVTGIYAGFYDRVYERLDDNYDGHTKAIWLGIGIFFALLLLWIVAVPLAVVVFAVIVLRTLASKK